MNFKIAIVAVLLPLSVFADALKVSQKDPQGDIHHNDIRACNFHQDTDILNTDLEVGPNTATATFRLVDPVFERAGFKEYYLWLDVNPEAGTGYQPYNPRSVAWPDLFADYRVYFSINASTHPLKAPNYRTALQSCTATDCASDDGLKDNRSIKATVQGNTVQLQWSLSLTPELKKVSSFKVGYTTYYEQYYCNGEDDSPQWGEKAHTIIRTQR